VTLRSGIGFSISRDGGFLLCEGVGKMAERKRIIAKWAVGGISVLGILFGFYLFSYVFFVIVPIPSDDLTLLVILLTVSGILLALGAYMIYTSYLMLRGKAFGAIESISVLAALIYFGSVEPFFEPLGKVIAAALGNEKLASSIVNIIGLAALISMVLVYLICVKFLKKLLEVAYGPKRIQLESKLSGTEKRCES
jgi:hypothetical protein